MSASFIEGIMSGSRSGRSAKAQRFFDGDE
jgi:hypothetical protein